MPTREYSYSNGSQMVCVYFFADDGKVEVALHDNGVIERASIRDMDEAYFMDLCELRFDALKCVMEA